MVFEKPHGLFDATLYFSAQLELPGSGKTTADGGTPRLKLSRGVVQVGAPANATATGGESADDSRLELPPAARLQHLPPACARLPRAAQSLDVLTA